MQKDKQVVIRQYERADRDTLRKIAKACSEEDIIHMIEQQNTLFTYTALLEEEIIGTVFAWTSTFHSNCTYFRIFTSPSIEQTTVEEELFDVLIGHINEHKMDQLPLQTSTWETSVWLRRMYEERSFEETKRTYEPLLKVDEVLLNEPMNNENTIKTVAEIAGDETLKKNFMQLVQRNYTRTHVDNPVSERIGHDVWEQLIFADDLIKKGSYVYVDMAEKEVIAYSLLHTSDQEDTFELGWCGAKDARHEKLIPRLVQHQVSYAEKRGVQQLLGEFDTTDEAAMGVLSSFPFAPCPTWITYSLKLVNK